MEQACRHQYLTLLLLLEGDKHKLATTYVRELAKTRSCDKYLDLSVHRQTMAAHMENQYWDDVQNYSDNQLSRPRAEQAVWHYYTRHRESLLGGLTWRQWFWFKT